MISLDETDTMAARVINATKGNPGGALSFNSTWITFFINSTDQTSGGSRP